MEPPSRPWRGKLPRLQPPLEDNTPSFFCPQRPLLSHSGGVWGHFWPLVEEAPLHDQSPFLLLQQFQQPQQPGVSVIRAASSIGRLSVCDSLLHLRHYPSIFSLYKVQPHIHPRHSSRPGDASTQVPVLTDSSGDANGLCHSSPTCVCEEGRE